MNTYLLMNNFLANMRELDTLTKELYPNKSNLDIGQKICGLIRSEVYGGAAWTAVAGSVDSELMAYVNKKNPGLIHSMAANNTYLVDYSGQNIDLPHFAATLDVYLSSVTSPKEWGGWAGDLGSLVKTVQTNLYNTSDAENFDKLVAEANRLFLTSGGPFSKMDLIADIDAENVVNRMGSTISLSNALTGYYASQMTRYTEFVNHREGSTYFMNNIMNIMQNDLLYNSLLFIDYGDYVSASPSFVQRYAVSGVFINYILGLRNQGL